MAPENPIPEVVTAPVAGAPVAAPTPAPPVPDAAPVAAPAPAVEAPKHPAEVPSLLDAAIKPPAEPPKPDVPAEPPKPGEPEKPAEAQKPVEAEKPAEPPKPVEPEKIEWKIEVPEGIKMDAPLQEKLTGLFDRMAAPKDAADRATAVSDLMTMHRDAMQDFARTTYENKVTTFNKTREGWPTR